MTDFLALVIMNLFQEFTEFSRINISSTFQQLLKFRSVSHYRNLHMIHTPSKPHIYHQKGFLDDGASQTSSTATYRLRRKQDELSASRRSSKNSSESSLQAVDMSKFYVKMVTRDESTSQPLRTAIIKRTNQSQRTKRRSPTPAHTKKGKTDQSKKDQIDQVENEFIVADLERRCNQQKKAKEVLEKRVIVIERELKTKLKKIDDLQRKNADLTDKNQTNSKKLQEFQQIASINQSNLNEAKNNLQKLRAIIKKNRCQELELQNGKLRKQNTALQQEVNNTNAERTKQKELITSLEDELGSLRRENERFSKGLQLRQKKLEIEKLKQALTVSKSQKEEDLQRLIMEKSESQMRHRLRAEKLEITIAYANRKKNEEIQQLKLKHLNLLGKMRTKLCILREQYNDLREEHENLRSKGPVPSLLQRRSLLLSDHKPAEDLFLFDLSP